MSKRIAILDLGTNTFHILIAEVLNDSFAQVYKEKICVKIGENGISFGFINKDAEERAIKAMTYFAQVIKDHQVTEIHTNATSAFRNAINGVELATKIEAATGLKVNIISGQKEAELIYYGVQKALNIGKETSMILDIGGGSNEFIICNDEQIFWKGSFEIGAQRLVDIFHEHDPILKEDLVKMDLFLENQLKELIQATRKYKPSVLIGASGAFDTIGEIFRQENGIKRNGETEFRIPIPTFKQIHADVIEKNRAERMLIPGMIEMRVEMIVVASCLINFVIKNVISKISVHQHIPLRKASFSPSSIRCKKIVKCKYFCITD